MMHFFAPAIPRRAGGELPEVVRELEDAGALRFNPLREVPDEMIGGFRDTDDERTTP